MRIERDGELALVRMEAGKANSMNREMLAKLLELFRELEDSDARGVVITGDGRSFCAGLALTTLIDLDRGSMRGFIDAFSETMTRLFRLGLPVVAAIDGHAIAGGCVLAAQCDVRIAAEGAARIGINEVQLGIGVPSVVLEPMRLLLPPASFVPVALEGKLFTPSEAKQVGLVDEVVAPTQLLPRAIERARELAAVPGEAFAQVKLGWRRGALDAIARDNDDVRERWLDTWFSADAQQRLRAVVERLRAKS
ncbi:MAG: enoyl-CoA hydratase/isomerase family protein [Deltaproteobacteria bacterium]|nr:enoyl-CoA hydratase/isomerase family protein [Nannocystaceae bacterium]